MIQKDVPAEYGVLIQKFRLIDDTFFNVCFDNYIEGMQLLLRISSNTLSHSRVRTTSMGAAYVLMCWRRTARGNSTTAKSSVRTRGQSHVGHGTTAA